MARNWNHGNWISVAVCLMALPVSCARQKDDGNTHDPVNAPLPKNESSQLNPEDTVFVATIDDPDSATTVQFYAPVERLTAKGALRDPLLRWARLWDVESRAEIQRTERHLDDWLNPAP